MRSFSALASTYKRLLLLVTLASLVVVADQALKHWSQSQLLPTERRSLVGQTLVVAPFANRYHQQRWIGTTALWVALFLRMVWRRQRQRELALWVTLLLAGAASNIWDQWRLGFIGEPLQLTLGPYRYPFNLADVSVWLGATMLAILLALRIIRESGRGRRGPTPVVGSRRFRPKLGTPPKSF